MGAAGMAGMDITSVMSTNVAGLGSQAIQGMAEMAAGGTMGAGMMGDMMEVGLVNQGTMAAMGSNWNGRFKWSYGYGRWRHGISSNEWWNGWNGCNGFKCSNES